MALYEKTDFSGGVVRDANEMAMPRNSMYDLRNVDPTRKAGALTLLKNVTKVADVIQIGNSVIYDWVYWTIPGVGDYIVMITDGGNIYYFDGTTMTFLVSIVVTHGEGTPNLTNVGDYIVVLDNSIASPSVTYGQRYLVYYDYDGASITYKAFTFQDKFELSDLDRLFIGLTNLGLDLSEDFGPSYNLKVASIFEDTNYSNGTELYVQLNISYPVAIVKITKSSGFQKAAVFADISEGVDEVTGNELPPRFLYEIDGSDKFFVPFLTMRASNNGQNIQVFFNETVDEERENPLGAILNKATYGGGGGTITVGTGFIDTGHLIRLNGKEYTISQITKTTISGSSYRFDINVGETVLTFDSEEGFDDVQNLIEVEMEFISNECWIPIDFRYANILGVPIDELRPEGGMNNALGRPTGFARNRFWVANPSWGKWDGQKKDDQNNGYLSWSYITGDGGYAVLTCPNSQLIAPSQNGSEIIALEALDDNMIVLQKHAVSRIDFQGEIPRIIQNKERGIQNWNQFFRSNKYFVIYSYGRLYLLNINKNSYVEGFLDLVELSLPLATELESTSDTSGVRVVYDEYNDHIYVTDINNNISTWICSLRRGQATWFRWSTNPVVAAFSLRGEQYYILRAVDGSEDIFKRDASDEVSSSVIIQDHPFYSRLGNDFIRKVELLYKGGAGLTFELYIDDSLAVSHIMNNHTNISIEEVVIPRSSQNRFNKMHWKISGNTSDGFEFHGIFINRDKYSEEAARGY